jgi:hypothetical protein
VEPPKRPERRVSTWPNPNNCVTSHKVAYGGAAVGMLNSTSHYHAAGNALKSVSLGDTDELHTQVQAQADEQAETMRVSVGTPKGELVVHLQVAGPAQFLPAGHQRLHHIGGLLAGHSGQR